MFVGREESGRTLGKRTDVRRDRQTGKINNSIRNRQR
jgi:hypothetical protein